jgi:exopolysaccharide biosynthesis polyprenyl glycosylphosphotransferase
MSGTQIDGGHVVIDTAAAPPVTERRRRLLDVPAHQPLPTRGHWLRRLGQTLVVADTVVIVASVVTAMLFRFGSELAPVQGLPTTTPAGYVAVAAIICALWLVNLALHNSRDRRVLGVGPEEYKRVFVASFRVFSVVAIVAFLSRIELARWFVAIAFALGTTLLLLERWVIRKWLHHRRVKGGWSHRVLVVGGRENVLHLVGELRRERYAGFSVVGVCLPGGPAARVRDHDELRVVGSLETVSEAVAATGADTVAVTPSPGLAGQELRRLAWSLEGTGVDLVVAPALTDVAGPRVHVRPVAGLPLLHVEAPQYEGPMRVTKEIFDRVMASLLVVGLSPVLLLIALAVKVTSRGPVIFKQQRVGRNGETFQVYKFRSMVIDAERMLAALVDRNEHDGVLFKMRADPRITPVGRWLRRLSLDELPQLFNVVKGDMSLVGPRPPLPSEVEQYERDVRRRLLVKPGITGLWQVSGRSDLSWEDSVRLDLYYVENWSMTGDLLILWKTISAVFKGRGAY